MIHGEPEADVYGMDVARYGDYARNRRYIKETTGQSYTRRFVLTYPNEQLPAGRPLKMSAAHSEMTAATVIIQSAGWLESGLSVSFGKLVTGTGWQRAAGKLAEE